MTKIKICGLTNNDDIALANRLKIDYAGFVLFFPKSRRNLTVERASELKAGLDGVKSVAVVVSPSPEQAESIAEAGFDLIQIHGELRKDTYDSCRLPILRAFNVSNIDEISVCGGLEKIVGYVFDAAEPGSGRTFDWTMLGGVPRGDKTVILAGGLTPQNVSAAIETVCPDGVDVSTGVEMPGGGKDARLAELFVNGVRGAQGGK